MLRLKNISVSYGLNRALDCISIDIEKGETVAVLGPNGVRKISLGRASIGLTRHEGTIYIDDQNVTGLRADHRNRTGISCVPSSGRAFPNLMVPEQIEICAHNLSGVWDLIGKRFPVLIEKADQHARNLSVEQQQLLSIARALASEPRYLVLDEPSAGLAPVVVEEVFDALRNLPDLSVGILLLEQNASLGLDLADRCAVLSGGKGWLEGVAGDMAGSAEIEELYLGLRPPASGVGDLPDKSAGGQPASQRHTEEGS